MKKREYKLVKKAGERKAPFRGFLKFKPAWDFLASHPEIIGEATGFLSVLEVVEVVEGKDKKDFIDVWVNLRPPFTPGVQGQGKTFEIAIINLANKVLKECGEGIIRPNRYLDPDWLSDII